MRLSKPTRSVAAHREAGVLCLHCDSEIDYGDELATCRACGSVHHWPCWTQHDGCGSYDCAPARRNLDTRSASSLKISTDELADAVPLPSRPQAGVYVTAASPASGPARRPVKSGTSGLAVASLAVAVLGIPLFGLVTGLVAIILGAVALATIRDSRVRGTGLAVAGVLLGTVDMVGWIVVLTFMFSGDGGGNVRITDFAPAITDLNQMAPHIGRAMKANVLIETEGGWRALKGVSVGSGVIIDIDDGNALIVTNRHVVDPKFANDESPQAGEVPKPGRLSIKMVGQPVQPGHIRWIAPDGIDLALVTARVLADQAQAVQWQADPELAIGSDVFAIGNPHGLGWTHTKGGISQLRKQRKGGRDIQIIQTSTAINAGNSGGGLYDKKSGMLIGINTWTNDKRFSEGLSFAISFHSLLELLPNDVKLPPAADAKKP